MSRGGKSSKKASSNGQNLVTILFVLGIIGWGFFAIDRLTESEHSTKSNKVQGRALGHEAGWKKSVRDWLTKKLSSEGGGKEVEGQAVSRNIPIEPEPRDLSGKIFRKNLSAKMKQRLRLSPKREIPLSFYSIS